jgi:hypothetical protein
MQDEGAPRDEKGRTRGEYEENTKEIRREYEGMAIVPLCTCHAGAGGPEYFLRGENAG